MLLTTTLTIQLLVEQDWLDELLDHHDAVFQKLEYLRVVRCLNLLRVNSCSTMIDLRAVSEQGNHGRATSGVSNAPDTASGTTVVAHLSKCSLSFQSQMTQDLVIHLLSKSNNKS